MTGGRRPFPILRIQGLQQIPGPDLPEVVEQLVEERRRAERGDLVHRPRLLQRLRDGPVVARRRLPSRQLAQPGPQILLAGDLARHATILQAARCCVQPFLAIWRLAHWSRLRTYSESQVVKL